MGDCHSSDPGSNPGPGVQPSVRIPTSTNINCIQINPKTDKSSIVQQNKNDNSQYIKYSEIPRLNGERRKAIVVGINEYEAGQDQIPELKGAENDAIELRDRLVKYGNFKISNDHYLVGPDATRRNIIRAINEVFRSNYEYDLVTFYFSGHGIVDDENNEGYLAPYDMDPEFPYVSGISMVELKKIIDNSKNKFNVIIILDCCYAGITHNDHAK